MPHRFDGSIMAALLLALLAVPAARAGQVRVNVASNFFSPRAVNCNMGDHVIWVWTSGSHSSTSGDTSGTGTPDGKWDSTIQIGAAPNNGSSFNWKSTGTGTFQYYCQPHVTLGMAGRVIVASTGIAVSDFRISEVLYNAPSGTHLIEIRNFGAAAGNLGRYRLAITTTGVAIPLNDVNVAAGATLTIHPNATGTNDANNVFLGTGPGGLGDLPASGALALYAPNTKPGGTALTDDKQIIDFVQWGAGGGPNEGTAVAASFWGAGDFVPSVASGHSIEYCDATNLRRGATHWFDNPTPNFGGAADNCLTPVHSSTWGRIKVLYR